MSTSANLARWLHANVSAIAASEDFDLIFTEIAEIQRDIERVIDRPVSPRFLGPCPEMVQADHDSKCGLAHPHACDTALRAHQRATEVKCDVCGTEHDVEELVANHLDNQGDYLVNRDDLLFLMIARGTPIPERTFREWRRTKRIPETFVSGEPRYRIADAVALLEAKPQTEPTGTRAKKRA